ARRDGAATRSRGSDDGLWPQRRLLRRAAFGLCGRVAAAAARRRAILRERSLRRPLRLRPAILLLSHATRWAVGIAASRASSSRAINRTPHRVRHFVIAEWQGRGMTTSGIEGVLITGSRKTERGEGCL